MAIHPIKASTHYIVAHLIKKYVDNPETVIDMGGIGTLKYFLPSCKIVDANIKTGIDATNLPYKDNSFDIACSVATLEHVRDQKKFLSESIRVAKYAVVHYFPLGEDARTLEKFRATLKNKHDCVIPHDELIQEFLQQYPTLTLEDYTSCDALLLQLPTFYKGIIGEDIYEMSYKMSNKRYGVLLHGRIK